MYLPPRKQIPRVKYVRCRLIITKLFIKMALFPAVMYVSVTLLMVKVPGLR